MNTPRITVIGGGTGLSVILRGLKKMTRDITAIVTVSDDGGGSGVLREDLGMLPPGDIRACLIALSDAGPYLEDLFNYRYAAGNLQGQSFGNLMIAAMQGLSRDFREAVLRVGEIIRINGQVLPVTLEDVHLTATLENGLKVRGESSIPCQVLREGSRIREVTLDPAMPRPTDGVLQAIEEADVIILGPGSLYTSVIPNLLVSGVGDAIRASQGLRVCIANLMTQPGETDGFSLSEHLEALYEHGGPDLLDAVICNTQSLQARVKDRYRSEHARQLKVHRSDRRYLEDRGIRLIEGDYLEVVHDYCRHDADRIAETIRGLLIAADPD